MQMLITRKALKWHPQFVFSSEMAAPTRESCTAYSFTAKPQLLVAAKEKNNNNNNIFWKCKVNSKSDSVFSNLHRRSEARWETLNAERGGTFFEEKKKALVETERVTPQGLTGVRNHAKQTFALSVSQLSLTPPHHHLYGRKNKPNLTSAVWQTQYRAVVCMYRTGVLTERDGSYNKVLFLSRLCGGITHV